MKLFESLQGHKNVVIEQHFKNGNLKAFAHVDGMNIKLQGEDAKALVEKVRSEGGLVHSVDDTHLVIDRGLDLQAHLRYPGQEQKETLEGGLRSAFEGGYDSVVAMPNTNPFLDGPEKLEECLKGIAGLGFDEVQVAQSAAASIDMKGREITDIPALKTAGAIAITDDGWGVESDELQKKVFELCARADLIFMQHAERPGHGGFASRSEFQTRHEVPEYPRDAESWMVKRDVKLLKEVPGARYHVLHVTTSHSVEAIAKAKEQGLNITAEVSPHHLFFCNEDIPDETDRLSTNYKMNPPLFSSDDRATLRQALKEGVLDCVSTDHAPHQPDEKANSWLKAPFGTRGLETAVSALCTLCDQGHLSYEDLEFYFSTRPREILAGQAFGSAKGFVIIDKAKEWTVSEEDLSGISKNSIFLGQKLKGQIVGIVTPKGIYTK